MLAELHVEEAFALGVARGVVPRELAGAVRSLTGQGDAVVAVVDPAVLPGQTGIRRLAMAVAGNPTVTVRLVGWADGVATVHVAVEARGLPVHAVLGQFLDRADAELRARGVPDGAVRLERVAGGIVAHVTVDALLAPHVPEVHVTELGLHDGVVRVVAAVRGA